MNLDLLKKQYVLFEKKFKLPSFQLLNEEFEVFKAGKDKDCFLRSIRKAMMEKIVNSLGFLDMILNPVNAPRIYMPYLKSMSQEDKVIVEHLYTVFAELSILSLAREIEYSEKEEALLIKRLFDSWQQNKSDFKKILQHIQNPLPESARRERSYFG